MDKTQEEINRLFKEIDENPDRISEVLEESFKRSLSQEKIDKYEKLKDTFKKLKQKLEEISSTKIIAEKIKDVRSSGQDRLLTYNEERIRKNINLNAEREILILKVFQGISSGKIKLNSLENGFNEYTISNFYRTFCEIAVKLFTDILLIIVDFNLSKEDKDDKYLISQEKNKRDILKDSLGLDGLRTILGEFDKDTGKTLNIVKVIDEYFLYKEGKGFSLRNEITHEKLFLSEIDSKSIIDEIMNVNLFNHTFINIFYFSIIGEVLNLKDMKLSKDIFANPGS